MKCVFVRFVEKHGKDGGNVTRVTMVRDELAESQEYFIHTHKNATGVSVTIINWFEVPENWENAVTGDCSMNDAFEALIGLDALSDTPLVSDLLTTIFEAGFKCGQKHEHDVQSAFSAGKLASGK